MTRTDLEDMSHSIAEAQMTGYAIALREMWIRQVARGMARRELAIYLSKAGMKFKDLGRGEVKAEIDRLAPSYRDEAFELSKKYFR